MSLLLKPTMDGYETMQYIQKLRLRVAVEPLHAADVAVHMVQGAQSSMPVGREAWYLALIYLQRLGPYPRTRPVSFRTLFVTALCLGAKYYGDEERETACTAAPFARYLNMTPAAFAREEDAMWRALDHSLFVSGDEFQRIATVAR